MCAENVCCWEVLGHQCLRSIAETGWNDGMSNA